MDFAEHAKRHFVRYSVNAAFTQATVEFSDGSALQFEHSSRTNRWAKASAEATVASEICNSIRQFRLNAKHLQLFFEDGSNVEFL